MKTSLAVALAAVAAVALCSSPVLAGCLENTPWGTNIVPYIFDSSLSALQVSRITTAMINLENTTGIKFVVRTGETDWLNFQDGTGCSSPIGRQGGAQNVNFASTCSVGNAMHEIGHALGACHEQSRQDRDTRVTIIPANIEAAALFNFDIAMSSTAFGLYDYGSIMHYGEQFFSANMMDTIVTIPPGIPIGQRVALSDTDVAMYNQLIGCFDNDGDGSTNCDDCNDFNASIYPGAPEQCNGVDDDCDGVVPGDEIDNDADGASECQGDCDDTDPTQSPSNSEVCDGRDNNCNGNILPSELTDDDGDGALACNDCDDSDAARHPGCVEICDGLDNDCDGVVPAAELIDEDGDGVAICADCNDHDATVFPGADELEDGLDNDCNGIIEELVGSECEWTYTGPAWNTGFTVQLTIWNNAITPVNGWTVRVGLEDNEVAVPTPWNAHFTQLGNGQIELTDMGWNAVIPAGTGVPGMGQGGVLNNIGFNVNLVAGTTQQFPGNVWLNDVFCKRL